MSGHGERPGTDPADDGQDLVHLTGEEERQRDLRRDVAAGLAARPRSLPRKLAYDARGSELFEEITRLPEYHPTRTERALLARRAGDLARLTRAEEVVELGAGSAEKTRLVLDALEREGTLRRYAGVDVSAAALRQALGSLRAEHPDLELRGVVADVERDLDRLPGCLPSGGRTLVLFLGTTLGNLLPPERARLLAGLARWLRPGDHLLLGVDLVRDPARLLPAYDDPAGASAAFNLNVLEVLRRELGASAEPGAWEYAARWDAAAHRVEVLLRARRPAVLDVPELGVRAEFGAGEELLTGVSEKFDPASLAAELSAAGFDEAACWTARDPGPDDGDPGPDDGGTGADGGGPGDYAVWVGRRR